MLKNTVPRISTLKAAFNWVTQAGSSVLRNLPFGGAIGVVASGVVLWFAPQVIPLGWSAEAVLSLGMGSGIVMHRLIDGIFGWIFEPARRHLGARWEAWIRLGKLDRNTLVAFYIHGQSLIEMSDEFAAPIGTIKRRLHVARKRLAKELECLQAV